MKERTKENHNRMTDFLNKQEIRPDLHTTLT